MKVPDGNQHVEQGHQQAFSSAELDRSLVRGVFWTGSVKWLCQGFSWVATLLVARLLTAEDFGIVGMATVLFGLIALLTEFGIGAAVVVLRDLTSRQIRQLNSLAVLFGIAGCLVSLAAAVPVSRFFRTPELVYVICALSVTFITSSFRSIPTAVMQRNLRFRTVALLDGVHAFVMSATWVALAFLGLRYWTLVLGAIAGSVVAGTLAVAACPTGFAKPRAAALRPALTLSRHLIVTRLCWYGYSNADFVIAGRLLGRAALGSYSFAWTLASLPVEKISALVGQVTPGVLSAAQSQRSELRRYFIRVTGGLAILTFPAAVGLSLVADDFIRVALGSDWESAIVPLRILALYATLRSIVTLLPQLLVILGEARFVMYTNLLGLAVLPVLFAVGSRWGPGGIAAAWVVGYPLVAIPLYRKLFRSLQMTAADYMQALWSPLTGCLLMVATVTAVRYGPGVADMDGVARLCLLSGTGALTYAASLILLFPQDAGRIRRLVARRA